MRLSTMPVRDCGQGARNTAVSSIMPARVFRSCKLANPGKDSGERKSAIAARWGTAGLPRFA